MKARYAILILFSAMAVMAGCGPSYDEMKRQTKAEQERLRKEDSLALKIGVLPTLDCLPVYVAKEHGLFDTAHADIRLVQFMAQTQDLAVAPFIDLVPGDNGVHFSTQSAVSTFENAYGIAARIQACLDDLFPGVWDVKVYENLDGDFEKKISEAVDFSIDGGTCLEACDRMYDTWGIGWTHYKDSTSGKDVLLFGRPNTRTSDNTSPDFIFGPGSGLTALKKSVANSDEIGTRLRVFGSSRNIPTSYYRGLDIYNGEGADIQNLMIPLSKWGKTDGKPDARKAPRPC